MKFSVLGLVVLASLVGSNASNAVTYTYETAQSNPMYNPCGVTPLCSAPVPGAQPDYMTLSFSVPFFLASNAVYDIGVLASTSAYVSSWGATDSLLGLNVSGVDQTIARVPSPGALAGSQYAQCDASATCFVGAIATNKFGQITQWNLVANSPAADQPAVSFSTYKNSFLGSVDAIGAYVFEENTLNGKTGDWSRTGTGTATQAPEIDPASAASGLTLLLGGLATLRGRRKLG